MADKFKKMGVNFKTKVRLINNSIENVADDEIPKVDVIVSEWMGYFLLFKNMVGSYIYTIKKFLKVGGVMIPSKSIIYLNAAAYKIEKNELMLYKFEYVAAV